MIKMNDFTAEPNEIRQAMLDAAQRVFESGWYVLGNEVAAFENTWAGLCGTNFGIGVGNGMDAIEIALRAIGVGNGDEVITTSMTAFATVLAIVRAGATPVLADIDPNTALLSIESVRRCISSKTKAIILVHLYGHLHNMLEWNEFCDRNGLYLIEDCAQAHLATFQGKVAGSFGIAGAYSFYPTKNLGAPGDAGMLVTSNQCLADKAARLRNYGQSVRYTHSDLGLNSRLDELLAAILTERFRWLPKFTERRREIAIAYQGGIKNPIIRALVPPEERTAHVYHLYVVLCEQRARLQNHLEKHGIQSFIHYPISIHQQVPCKDFRRDPMGLDVSEFHAARCLSLPCHPQMTNQDVGSVIDAVNSFCL
jgi:dTDP-4-amino-4,6-dideoxygalactose transaminase